MEVCRICGGAESLKCFQENEQLTELLTVCANITINENDYLPKHICAQCETGLRFSYQLRKQSEETEKRLRQEMQPQSTNSTTIDILDEFSAHDVDEFVQTTDLITHKSLISEININISTTTKETDCLFGDEEHTQEVIASTSLSMEIEEHQNIVEILDDDNVPELTDEERLRLDLQKRGVFMQKRIVPIENETLKEITERQQVIAEKRIQLDIETYTDEFNDGEVPTEECLDILSNEIHEVHEEDDIIEVIDDDSTPVPFTGEVVCEALNSHEYQDTDFIEEIISSDEEDLNADKCIDDQTDIVYEESVEDIDEAINIDDCQMHFMKEECNAIDGSETYLENETVKMHENEFIETIIDEDSGAHNNAGTGKEICSYTCSTCDLQLCTPTEYREHIKTHGEKRFHCELCDKWFPLRSRLERHLQSHENKVKLQCPHCERTYQTRCNLMRHIRTVHDKVGYICDICGLVFGRTDVLKIHMTKHTMDGDLQCEQCSKRFNSINALKTHINSHLNSTNDSPKPAKRAEAAAAGAKSKKLFYCHYCGKESKHHFTHKMHMRIHTQERPHKCEACDKAFRTMAALITHERIHDDARPYQCEHCLLSFRQQGHLKEHRMIHEGITPHVCSICQLAFTKKNNMLVHMRIHSGENPYKCIICDKQFKKATQLRKHESEVHKKSATEENLMSLEKTGVEANVNAGDSLFVDLATELLCSNSNSLELIETENATSIEGSALSSGGFDDMPDAIRNVVLEQTPAGNAASDFVGIDSGVVLVVDDNAKFNSLFIMDD
ncbi:zinc finger and SCAN domain-containing protein 12-like [Zeugodacus cucurbitae]|uniref:zinc finger and SCAN domain-containing protein 12-like n=1 Tax=Zeugodacus cucurbitae TaxID=28588 RepID=UPI0023D904EA|nr:zinc finger and SCAN domain-containing protein 12-like [Zeugodacus cucurbitae]